MSDSVVLDYLREQFALVHTRLDALGDGVHHLKVGMSAVEAGLAGVNDRLDRLDARVDRIERRLELVGAG